MSPRPPANFIADAMGLDFLNSIATPVDLSIDWLGSGDGLLTWLAQADLVPPEAIKQLCGSAMPGAFDGVAAQARSLREWFRSFVKERMGRPLTADDLTALQPLNRLLERDEAFKAIVIDGTSDTGRLALRVNRRWRAPESVLLPIAESLARFVCDENFADVKSCEGENCTLMFADHTRGRQRRWCSMAVCGNRAKQAAHRNRLRSTATH
jgi:predicted RNA-binding Zn ribbon-like protein